MESDGFFKRDEQGHPVISERGTGADGNPIYADRRLYMMFQAFEGNGDPTPLIHALKDSPVVGALYLDVLDPRGVGLVACSDNPDFFAGAFRTLLTREPFASWSRKDEMTMFGRTYTIGYESDLEHVLVNRPMKRVVDPKYPWAVWYPLRRTGEFSRLPEKDQRSVLAEHGMIGNAFGTADFAHDIRLACHGMDKNDNDFVVGLVGKELYPLSFVVQTMRKTRQTSTYLERLGPFFVGKVIWQGGLYEMHPGRSEL